MLILDSIEKLITEHGSAAILSQQLAFARDQFSDMERKVSELQTQIGRLGAQLERERTEKEQARGDLQRLRDEHAEEVRFCRSVEFRRGKRTGGKWMAFCPNCHLPVVDGESMSGALIACCTAKHDNCGWHVYIPTTVVQMIQEIEANCGT